MQAGDFFMSIWEIALCMQKKTYVLQYVCCNQRRRFYNRRRRL